MFTSVSSDFKASSFQMGFVQPASSSMLGIVDLHHTIMFYLIVVFFLVSWVLLRLIINESGHSFFFTSVLPLNLKRFSGFQHCALLEIVWTVLPSLVIFSIAIPSLSLLHSIDEFIDPLVTLKVIGNQWYWSYEYSDYTYTDLQNSVCFDSNLNLETPVRDLLEVDREVVLPSKTTIRFLITAEDVLHSWAVPSLGIKMDAVPGRLNQVISTIYKPGFFYGQCSELCGIGHGFMPIKIKVVSVLDYYQWVCSQYLLEPELSLPYSSNGILEFFFILKKRESGSNLLISNYSFLMHTGKQSTAFFVESLLKRVL